MNNPCKAKCKITWDWIQKKMDREALEEFQKKFITIFECMGMVDEKEANKQLNKHANMYWRLTMKYITLVNKHPQIDYNKLEHRNKYRSY